MNTLTKNNSLYNTIYVEGLGSGAIHLIPSQFFFFTVLLIFYIEWLRFKVAFCNFKSQPSIPIALGAIP